MHSHIRKLALPSALVALSLVSQAQTTTRVSVDSLGALGNSISSTPAISYDGRYAAFASQATNLVAPDTNSMTDVFVYDRASSATSLVSVSSAGVQGNSHSGSDAISLSGDGRYVVFGSFASNLAAGDPNVWSDVYLRDRVAGTTQLVSVNTSGVAGNGVSRNASISADGRFVAFESFSNDLDVGDVNGTGDIFVRDLVQQTTARISKGVGGVAANSFSSLGPASISADGRYVAFQSVANNLIAGDTNSALDDFVFDRQTSTMARISVATGGAQSNGPSYPPAISGDGRYVAFRSSAANLVAGDANNFADVFVHDRVNVQTTRVSVSSSGVEGNSNCSLEPTISGDGRYVAFQSSANNLVAHDTNASADVFRHDLQSGATTRVDIASAGAQANIGAANARIDGSGNVIAFSSASSFLAPGVVAGTDHVYVHDATPWAQLNYCTAGSTSLGCSPTMSAVGTPRAVAAGFTLQVNGVDGQRTGLIFYGVDNTAFVPTLWGNGAYLCVKAPTQRTTTQSTGGTSGQCDGSLQLDWNAFMHANPSALGNPLTAGQYVYAQGWFRDPGSAKTTALSEALGFVVQP